jgi:hypothetical protein
LKNRIASLWRSPDRRNGFRLPAVRNWQTAPPGREIGSREYRGVSFGVQAILQISIGSCDERKSWLELTRDEGYLDEKESGELGDRFGLLDAMLKSLWQHWKNFER